MKLKNKLICIFILFSITIISLASIIIRVYIEHNFNKYAANKMEESKTEIYKKVEKTYRDNEWNINNITFIGYDALKEGLLISIKEKDGNIIWDAREYNNLECETILAKVRYNTNKINPKNDTVNTIEEKEIIANNKVVGTISVEYIGPLYFDDSDVILYEMLNDILIILAIVFLVFSIILGMVVSSSLNKPILKVIEATKSISGGNYSKKILEESNIEEVNELIISVNKMSENIKHQENLRKIMTRDISHEIRTPLTTIQAHLEAIMDGLWEPSHERLKSIHEEIQRLNRLIVSSDELFKYDSGEMILNKSEVDISNILYIILINFEKDFLDNKIKLEMNLNNCKAFVDKDKISQVIINIISNSIKYTGPGKKIIVNCYEENNRAIISIKDNGIGISEENLEFIFERFYRVDKSRNKDSGGLGVGLTISKAIVDAHKGKISVNSKAGEGSEFIVSLPK